MATNFDKFKQMLEKRAESVSTDNKSKWLKLDKGQSKTVRFLPLKSQDLAFPIQEYYHHAITMPDGKYESFVCPRESEGLDCPFCKLASEMWQQFAATNNEKYKDAFKHLVVKAKRGGKNPNPCYLMVGYDVNAVDPSNITEADTFIVRVSAKEPIAQIENFLRKEKDFVDFTNGRNCTLTKPVADKQAITWLWELDTEPAFTGKSGETIWKKLIEVSPDLSEIVAVPSPEKLASLMARFKAAPSESDNSMEQIPEEPKHKPVTQNRAPVDKTEAKDDSDAVDLESLRKMIED